MKNLNLDYIRRKNNLEKMKNYASQIENLLVENKISAEVGYSEINIFIEIIWGDWKHQHMRTKYLISQNFHTEETETDGSDCFSAIHYFYFY